MIICNTEPSYRSQNYCQHLYVFMLISKCLIMCNTQPSYGSQKYVNINLTIEHNFHEYLTKRKRVWLKWICKLRNEILCACFRTCISKAMNQTAPTHLFPLPFIFSQNHRPPFFSKKRRKRRSLQNGKTNLFPSVLDGK